MGEAQPGSKTKSFLGNLALKIFHQQNETETCAYAADQIGKEYRYLDNFHMFGASSNGEQAFTPSFGGSQQLVHIVEPLAFTALEKPNRQNPCAQAIVYNSGRTFNATKTARNPKGLNYLSVLFSRE